ncbi:MAG TPA: DUF4956 domain-containing protein [Bacteriovoracaceae bacterium]|nr:DUF4956 domain-containing protein [Bacteriovoracaceae bacterium]
MLDLYALETLSRNPALLSLTLVYSVTLSFLTALLICYTYKKTFQGLSYSRNLIQAMILGSCATCVVMYSIGDSLARGMGMMGALAILRFKSSIRDPRDMIFVFASLGIGIACGTSSYRVAIIGAIGFCLIAVAINKLPFTQESAFDGLLRFNLENDPVDYEQLKQLLAASCSHFALVTLRDIAQGTRLDYAYQVKLKTNIDQSNFLQALSKLKTIRGLSLLMQDTTVEL